MVSSVKEHHIDFRAILLLIFRGECVTKFHDCTRNFEKSHKSF
jgi:hypothetical protein